MIRNEDELKIVREQLVRADSALDSLRNEVLPKGRQMYEIMAEPCVDTRVKLRRAINTYSGFAPMADTRD